MDIEELGQVEFIDWRLPAARLNHKYDRIVANRKGILAGCIRLNDVKTIRHTHTCDPGLIRVAQAVLIPILENDARRRLNLGCVRRGFRPGQGIMGQANTRVCQHQAQTEQATLEETIWHGGKLFEQGRGKGGGQENERFLA